jgi:Tol biopolymer transport system component
MESLKKYLPAFDLALFGGLGCGALVLCILGSAAVYIWRNPPGLHASATETAVGLGGLPAVTATPGLNIATPTFSPTLVPTLEATLPATSLPLFIPDFGGGPAPTGKIVFACYINQIDQICIMNADGTGRKQLTNFSATAFYPSLSPDGQTVYFSSNQTGNFEIYSIDINGNALQRLTTKIGSLYAPELSPNGERIIFTNNGNGLWVMNPDGSNPHALTSHDDIDPTWSADGSMIAFASNRQGQRQLFVANANGRKVDKVTNLNKMGGRSSWSPDGDWIAFTTFRDGNNEIYIVHPDGRGETRLTNSLTSDWQPRWGR